MNRAYHDTYYVVAHGHYLISLAVTGLLMGLAWWGIIRLSDPPPHRLRTWTLAGFVLGLILSNLGWLFFALDRPMDQMLALFGPLNALSTAGAALTMLTCLVTVVALVRAGLRRLSARR